MKRELIRSTVVFPLSDAAVDRDGYLSAIVAVKTEDEVSIKVNHSDDKNGEYTAVSDPYSIVSRAADADVMSFGIDLSGCKRYIKIEFEGDGAGSPRAIALGDPSVAPSERDDTGSYKPPADAGRVGTGVVGTAKAG